MVEQGATLILVIGSETSANAQRLVEVAKAAGAAATLVDGESAFGEEFLEGHEVVGPTAGASTPEELVRATARRLPPRRASVARRMNPFPRGCPFPSPRRGLETM